jgi:hypothetical protein
MSFEKCCAVQPERRGERGRRERGREMEMKEGAQNSRRRGEEGGKNGSGGV